MACRGGCAGAYLSGGLQHICGPWPGFLAGVPEDIWKDISEDNLSRTPACFVWLWRVPSSFRPGLFS